MNTPIDVSVEMHNIGFTIGCATVLALFGMYVVRKG